MGSEWRECRLGDLADEITVGHVGPMPAYVDEGIPFLRSQNIDRLRIDDSDLKSIDSAAHDRLRKSALHPGDVVIVRTGRPGACAVIPPSIPVANCADLVVIRCGRELDPWFLAYYINSAAVHGVSSQVVGAVQQHFNVGSARDLTVRLPDVTAQRDVVAILRALDDKIELNRRMSQTLESMARAVFKSWFVDFDPVRAKSEGRDTHLAGDIGNLFPASFRESDIGEIPTGWRTSTIGSELKPVLGGTPSRIEPRYWEGGTIPWVNSGKVNEFRITQPTEFITEEGLARSATTLLPPRTTVVAITGATLGQVSLLEIGACANQSIVGVLGSPDIPSEYIYLWIKANIASLVARKTGAAQQHVNTEDVAVLGLMVAPPPVMAAWLVMVKPLFDRIASCCFEAEILTDVREALLPRLLSRRLRIGAGAGVRDG
jgi:type I restriction enzyme, S subunit